MKSIAYGACLAILASSACDCADPAPLLPDAALMDAGMQAVVQPDAGAIDSGMQSMPDAGFSTPDAGFATSATYDPAATLAFGPVAVSGEIDATVTVTPVGGGTMVVTRAHLSDQMLGPKFPVALRAEGRGWIVTVTYRPCPDAWNGNQLKQGYDFNNCPMLPDTATLVIDDSTGGTRIALQGQPALPPLVEVHCSQGGGHCNEANPQLASCATLVFGTVSGTPCDLEVEIKNFARNGPTGPLLVQSLGIKVYEISDTAKTLVDGKSAGFEIVDQAGNAVTAPLSIAIPRGQVFGSKKIKVRFTGTVQGAWRGEAPKSGLALVTNDPDQQPLLGVSLSATGN